ncbi:hypothetical protein HDU91_000586, partial [Kappamyces sp. JEL0680]
LSESELVNRVYKTEQSDLERRLLKKEQEYEELHRAHGQVQSDLKNALKSLEDSKLQLSKSHYAETSYVEEVKELKKVVESRENEIEKHQNTIAALRATINQTTQDMADSKRVQLPLEEVSRREEKLALEAQEQETILKREAEAKNLMLRHEIATLKNELSKKETECFEISKSYEGLKQQNQELNRHYNALHDSAKQMNYTLDRKEHDLNMFKAKATELETDNKEAFNIIITGLTNDVKGLQEEKEKLKTLWLESQKELVMEQTRYKALIQENDALHTKLGISEGVKHKTGKEIAVIEEESFEHKQEAAKLYNELRKLQPIVAELQDQKSVLEQKLHESELKLQESHINHTTTKQMLRTEIRRLSQDRSNLRQEKVKSEASVVHVERNTQLYKEMIDKLKSERYELQRELYGLKRRADQSDKKYFDLKMKLRQMEKLETKRKSESVGKLASIPPGHWNSFVSLDAGTELPPTDENSPRQSSAAPNATAGEKIMQDLPDFDSLRLKLESLATEKEFLLNENAVIKKRMDMVNQKLENTTKMLRDTKSQVSDLTHLKFEQMEKMALLDQRYARAKKVAAHIEKQFKDAKPNSKIDYIMIGNPEPSTQLLAAILAKVDRRRLTPGRQVFPGQPPAQDQ